MRAWFFSTLIISGGVLGIAQGRSSSSSSGASVIDDSGPGTDVATVTDTGTSTDGATCLDAPPASGFSNIANGAGKQGIFGEHVAMALDDKGDPMIAYVHYDANGDSDGKDSTLYFTRWDRCNGIWTAPVSIDVVGSVTGGGRQVSITRDAATGAIGVAFQHIGPPQPSLVNDTPEVWVGQSTDKGKTWTTSQLSEHNPLQEGDIHTASDPSIAMNNGKMFVAYYQGNVDCDDLDGAPADTCNGWYAEGTSASWTRSTLPNLPGGFGVEGSVNVALDSANKPAVAYLVTPFTAYNMQVAFWRPGSTVIKVTDSNNTQNDDPALAMTFDGTKPRIVAELAIVADGAAELVFDESTDGITWDAPVTLPHDNTDGVASYEAIAADGKGNLAIAARSNTGTGDGVCGAPKLSRSSDGIAWTTCGADTGKTHAATAGFFVNMAYSTDGKLVMAFELTNNQTDALGTGVALWREP
ncbi:MAG: hypothetical protein ABI183_09350 [Polyangiaceae bacterium]